MAFTCGSIPLDSRAFAAPFSGCVYLRSLAVPSLPGSGQFDICYLPSSSLLVSLPVYFHPDTSFLGDNPQQRLDSRLTNGPSQGGIVPPTVSPDLMPDFFPGLLAILFGVLLRLLLPDLLPVLFGVLLPFPLRLPLPPLFGDPLPVLLRDLFGHLFAVPFGEPFAIPFLGRKNFSPRSRPVFLAGFFRGLWAGYSRGLSGGRNGLRVAGRAARGHLSRVTSRISAEIGSVPNSPRIPRIPGRQESGKRQAANSAAQQPIPVPGSGLVSLTVRRCGRAPGVVHRATTSLVTTWPGPALRRAK